MRAAPAADRRGAALLVVVVAFAAVGGCTAPAGSTEPSARASAAAPTSPPTPLVTPRPATDAPPSVAMPPDAILTAEGGPEVAGSLGSFTWGDAGSDAPWLPGAPASATAGTSLAVTVDGASIDSWDVRYGASRGPDPGDVTALGSGDGPISFEAPPAGSWTIALEVQFGDGLGSASYYWRLEVE